MSHFQYRSYSINIYLIIISSLLSFNHFLTVVDANINNQTTTIITTTNTIHSKNSNLLLEEMNKFSEKLKQTINITLEEAKKDLNKIEENVEKNFTGTAGMPQPWPISYIKPTIVFYKKGNKNYEIQYDSDPKEVAMYLRTNNFLNTKRLIFLTHGFHNNFQTDWLQQFKDLILNQSSLDQIDQTVAILGWGNGADIAFIFYRQAASNVEPVGEWFANYLQRIKEVQPKTNIYCIGHSLGAHVMGIAGRVSKSIDRITGLDPAGPCFEKVPDSKTLRASDAKFVDVIHTDGYDSKWDPSEWFFPVNHYGSLVPIGSLDFYPNFGYHQPGAGTFVVAGSHLRALDLFAWSIQNKGKFVTNLVLNGTPDFDKPVESFVETKYKAEMGFYADQWPLPPINSSTLYYIKTNKKEPWV